MTGFKCSSCGRKKVVAVTNDADGPHTQPSEKDMALGDYTWLCVACGDERPGARGVY